MKKLKKKMTPLDWAVYNFIKKVTLGNKDSVSQKQIYDAMKEQGNQVTWSDKQNQHNDHCRWLADCVERINMSPEVDHLIIHHAYRYRLATLEEALTLEAQYRNRIVLASKRRMAIVRKIKRHNQGKLLSNKCLPIDENSQAKRFHEAFNDAV